MRHNHKIVATVLTVYGIETSLFREPYYSIPNELQQFLPFTVLKPIMVIKPYLQSNSVATVLTVYGIETKNMKWNVNKYWVLQQFLPFTVLKLQTVNIVKETKNTLQQFLPFTVLKLYHLLL